MRRRKGVGKGGTAPQAVRNGRTYCLGCVGFTGQGSAELMGAADEAMSAAMSVPGAMSVVPLHGPSPGLWLSPLETDLGSKGWRYAINALFYRQYDARDGKEGLSQ